MKGIRLPTLDEAAAVMSRECEDYADLAPDVQERVLANIDELIADGHIHELNLKISGDDADNIYIGGAGELGKSFSLKTAVLGRSAWQIAYNRIWKAYFRQYDGDVWTAAVPVETYAEHVGKIYGDKTAKLMLVYLRKPTAARETAIEETYFRKSVKDFFERVKYEQTVIIR